MKISIIGLGLIGGSYALALKKRLEGLTICGWDLNKEHVVQALEKGIIDEQCSTLEEAIDRSDWIFVAIPVDAIEKNIAAMMDRLTDEQLVIDFGSTKSTICEVLQGHPKRAQFIAAHPIAGTEYSGPGAAFAELFDDKVMIVCDQEMTEKRFIERFRKQCKMLGMSTSYMSSSDHDVHLAYVSHLSHVISFGLSRTVLEKEESERDILDLAGSGFESTVRLAKSSPEMWTPIFMKNKNAMVEALTSYIEQVTTFKELLSVEDEKGIQEFLKKGREIRKILE
ncbi:MAG: prephenate dehydrogenase [Bacteroidota bacterium]